MKRFLLLVLITGILFAPYAAPYDPMQTGTGIQPPNRVHWLGTDQIGRDVLSRVLYGGRLTLLMASGAVLIAAAIGTLLGLSAGFLGGSVDQLLNAITNGLLAIPNLIFGLVLMTVLGQGALSTVLAVGISQIAPFAQFARTTAQWARNREYIEGGRAIGASPLYLLRYYVLPNCLPILLSYGSLTFGYCLLNVAAFGYLGLVGGIEWGSMLAEGREVIREAPWVSLAPGFALTFLVLSVNWTADTISNQPV